MNSKKDIFRSHLVRENCDKIKLYKWIMRSLSSWFQSCLLLSRCSLTWRSWKKCPFLNIWCMFYFKIFYNFVCSTEYIERKREREGEREKEEGEIGREMNIFSYRMTSFYLWPFLLSFGGFILPNKLLSNCLQKNYVYSLKGWGIFFCGLSLRKVISTQLTCFMIIPIQRIRPFRRLIIVSKPSIYTLSLGLNKYLHVKRKSERFILHDFFVYCSLMEEETPH